MSSNNGGGGFFALLLLLAFLSTIVSLIVAALIYALIGLGIVFGFIAFAWTLICLVAWNNPFRLGSIYLDPEDARAFILRGLFGAAVVPAFLFLADKGFDFAVRWEYLHYYIAGGYTFMSAGLEYLFARRADIPYVSYERVYHHYDMLPPPPTPEVKTLPRPDPFRFAQWDDDQERH